MTTQWSNRSFSFCQFSQLLAGETAKRLLDFSRLLVAANTFNVADFSDSENNREHDTNDCERGWMLVQADQTLLHCFGDLQLPSHLLQVLVPMGTLNEKREFFTVLVLSVEMLKSQVELRFDEKQLSEIDVIGVHEPVDLIQVDCLFEILLPIRDDLIFIFFFNELFVHKSQIVHGLLDHPRDSFAEAPLEVSFVISRKFDNTFVTEKLEETRRQLLCIRRNFECEVYVFEFKALFLESNVRF